MSKCIISCTRIEVISDAIRYLPQKYLSDKRKEKKNKINAYTADFGPVTGPVRNYLINNIILHILITGTAITQSGQSEISIGGKRKAKLK